MNQQINLYTRYQQRQRNRANQITPVKRYVLVVAVLILVLGAFSAKLFIDNLNLDSTINEYQTYVNDASNQKKLKEVNDMKDQVAALKDLNDKVNSLKDVFSSKQAVSSTDLSALATGLPSDTKFTQLSFDGLTFTVSITSDSSASPSTYANALRSNGYFANINYTGYSVSSDGKFTADIQCTLKGAH